MTRAAVRALGLFVASMAILTLVSPGRDVRDAGERPAFRLPEVRPLPPLDPERAETRFVSSGIAPSVHSVTAVELSRGRIRAVWYGGSREGASDVVLYSAVFDPEMGAWGAESPVATREQTARDLGRYVKKLGNPVIARDGSGRLRLFYVSVSVGGWSGSALNVRTSEDEGETFGPATRLVTSPFLNVSTLVRGPALLYEDGSLALPVYHEFLGKFGELLWLSPSDRVLAKTRLAHGRSSLQPVLLPLAAHEAVAFLRSSGSSPRRVLATTTADGGRSWADLTATPLPNPDAAVSAIATAEGILLAFNDSEIDRENLTLGLSSDGGQTFRPVFAFDQPVREASEPPRFAYPFLLSTSNGDLHVLYTWNRRAIVHVRFPAAFAPPQGG